MPSSQSAAVASTSQKTLNEPSADAFHELLTEHLGFQRAELIDAIVYAANEHLYSIGAQFEDFAKAALAKAAKKQKQKEKAKPDSHGRLAKLSSKEIDSLAEQGVHAVLTLLESALDRIFDLLELYCLKTAFGVRPEQARVIVLKHHRGLDLRTAAERAQSGEALTSEEESRELADKETELRRKIEEARTIKHLLRLAQLAAECSKGRVQRLRTGLGAILSTDAINEGSLLRDSLPQTARKLAVDTAALLEALDSLRKTDPLGASLTKLPEGIKNQQRPSEHERRNVLKASGVSDDETRKWRGREGYVNYEMERIMRSIRGQSQQRDPTATQEATVGGRKSTAPRASLAAGAIANANESPRSKRRRTTRYSMAEPADVEEHQAAQIGDAEAVEELVGRLV